MNELKNCPFCDGEATLKRKSDTIIPAEIVWVECKECGAMSGFFSIGLHLIPPRAKATDKVFMNVRNAWNRRIKE